MFDLALSDELTAIRDVARALGDDVLDSAARAAEVNRGLAEPAWATVLDTGLFAPAEAEYGGGGVLDALAQQVAAEALAHGDAAGAAAVCWSGNAALLIGLCGTPGQRAERLPALIGDPAARAAVALYEGFGRAPSEYTTTIQPEGDGWRVRGRKAGVVFGAVANPVIVVGTDRRAGGQLRAAVLTREQLSGPGAGTHLGLEAAGLATLSFDVRVGPDRILGGADADPAALSLAVSRLRLTTASLAIGCGQRAREYAAGYVSERVAFGKPLAGFQGVSFLVVDAQMQLDAARLQVWDVAATLADAAGDESDPAAVERAVTLAVGYATSIAAQVTRDCIQVLGGHGFITDHPVERWYRAAAGLAVLDADPTCSAFAPAL